MKRFIGVTLCAATIVGLGANAAIAGEITGNGKSLHPLKANSECAFSGLDDDDDDGFDRTQNWGQIPKADRDFLRTIGVAPNTLCNGNLNPMK